MNSQTVVKLNQAEELAVSSLPAEFQEQARAKILTGKQVRMAKVLSNRKEFSTKINDNGTIVIRGLNNRFPMGIRFDSLEILLSHVDELKAAIVAAKAHPANQSKLQ